MNKQLLIRVLVVLTLLLGTLYVSWRWLFSVNWENWWIAVPLVVAETYALIDAYLFGMTVWRIKRRGPAPEPLGTETVDVLITTFNEPVELVAADRPGGHSGSGTRTRRGSSTTVTAPRCARWPPISASATSPAPTTGTTGRGTRRPATSTTRCSPPTASSC